uniref:Putative secreted protein n=1 Tax=Anopheles darlingi TaxID=43151 RepID=A0A2M4D869_ANODA
MRGVCSVFVLLQCLVCFSFIPHLSIPSLVQTFSLTKSKSNRLSVCLKSDVLYTVSSSNPIIASIPHFRHSLARSLNHTAFDFFSLPSFEA